MRTPLLASCLVSLLAPATLAATHLAPLVISAQATAQFGKSKPGSQKQQVESLMARARAAMKEGNLAEAEKLIAEVEQSKVEFGLLHRGDTPRKLRADLNAAKKKNPVQKPSSRFEPEMPAEEAAAAPVRQRKTPVTQQKPHQVLDPDQEEPLVLPRSDGKIKPLQAPLGTQPTPDSEPALASPLDGPTNPAEPQGETNPQVRRQSDFHLLSARRALAVGDVKRASAAAEAAKQLNVAYGYHDDTPQKVETAIRIYRQVSETNAGRHDEASQRQLADVLMDQAQHLMRWKDYDEADRLVQHVQAMGVNYGPFDVKPEVLAQRIAAARAQTGGKPAAVQPAGAAAQAPPSAASRPRNSQFPASRAVYDQSQDPTRNRAASAQEEMPSPDGEAQPRPLAGGAAEGAGSDAQQLISLGEQALKERDSKQALDYFRQAYQMRDQLDPATAQRLQDRMQFLSAPPPGRTGKPELLLDGAASEQLLVYKQVSNDLAKKEIAADKTREKDPVQAMEILKEARAAVEAATVEPDQKAQLLRRVDRRISDLDKYIAANRGKIELEARNKEVLKEVDRRLEARLEVDEKLAQLVDQYNKLMDEQRYPEAEVLAKRARELDPDNPLTKQLIWGSKFVNRNQRQQSISEAKENGQLVALQNAEQAIIPMDDREPYQFGDVRRWEEVTKNRAKWLAENRKKRSEREIEIERKLKTPVSLKFRERPLTEVLDHLARLAAVNLHLDPKGLEEEGVTSEQLVTIDLANDIMLESALNLILEPLRLSYVIKDEVLKITSEQLRDGVLETRTYDVADLVIPIPNFTPNGQMGLPGAISQAYSQTGNGLGMSPASAYMASADGTPASGMLSPAVLAQMHQLMPDSRGGRMASGLNQPASFGPGGMGGGAQADFDSLIELITTTVRPTTWDEVGGPGSISEFRNNLSLVISQTEDVHEEIVDLLEQLRRNQDLQVTIEVRFITLADNFFEQIGVDFDFNIVNTSATVNPSPAVPPRIKREIVGLLPPAEGAPFPNFTGDLSIPFQQDSFTLAVPQFGTPTNVANFGFAILSDLEAFLLVNASQGDRRSNVLQAPKVTLFNGQQASVFDQTQQPFVISVIPVVGDFAAAYQPVITVLSKGTALTVQAVISHDRRFVRLTVLPLFSDIGEVNEFKVTGSETIRESASASESTGGSSGNSATGSEEALVQSEGVTIQLPNFSFVSVTTTVSVPDGGTVLLGGIKRLSEGRNEFGVPILSKLPYINRLFKNVGIGRETQSLMMMVTPRIIIQEEEEQRLGIQTPP